MAVGAAHFLDEAPHLVAVLDARLGLHAAGDVHRPWRGRGDGMEDVLRIQATCKNNLDTVIFFQQRFHISQIKLLSCASRSGI